MTTPPGRGVGGSWETCSRVAIGVIHAPGIAWRESSPRNLFGEQFQ